VIHGDRRRRRVRRGLSLFEVLVAMGLALALMGSLFGFLWSIGDTQRMVARTTERARAADLLITGGEQVFDNQVERFSLIGPQPGLGIPFMGVHAERRHAKHLPRHLQMGRVQLYGNQRLRVQQTSNRRDQ